MWSLFAGLVGLAIKTIEERAEIVGQIIGKIIGLAWSIAAVFAIPFLMLIPVLGVALAIAAIALAWLARRRVDAGSLVLGSSARR